MLLLHIVAESEWLAKVLYLLHRDMLTLFLEMANEAVYLLRISSFYYEKESTWTCQTHRYQLINGKDHLHHIVWMQHYSGQNMIRWWRQVVFVSQVLLRNIRCFFSSFLRDKTKNIMYKAFKCYYETTSFLYFVVLTIIHIVPSHVYG